MSYFAADWLAVALRGLCTAQLTLSQASIPRLVFFPPFCISLSDPTATPLKANICRRGLTGPSGGLRGALAYADHDPVREQRFKRHAHGCEGCQSVVVCVGWGVCDLVASLTFGLEGS